MNLHGNEFSKPVFLQPTMQIENNYLNLGEKYNRIYLTN